MYRHTLYFDRLDEAYTAQSWINAYVGEMVFGYTEAHRDEGPLYEFFTNAPLSQERQRESIRGTMPGRVLWNREEGKEDAHR